MPLSLLGAVYFATFLIWGFLGRFVQLPGLQWGALVSVVVATLVVVASFEHGRWPLGLAAPPRIAVSEAFGGGIFAAVLIFAGDGLILATTNLRHLQGNGFPWDELATIYLPAVLHEELLFRGYAMQKLATRWPRFAVGFMAAVFALLHLGNEAVSVLAIANIFVAGVLLGLTWLVTGRLWFAIGLHLIWNLLSGPILGYNVSGYESRRTVWRTSGSGAPILTGGGFGIEGSIWMLLVELLAVALVCWWIWRRNYNQRPPLLFHHLPEDS